MVITTEEPVCQLVFMDIVRLRGEVDGIAPRVPIGLLPEGGYVTGTYTPGRIAVWAEDGRFVQTIGRGRGAGPGEFEQAHDLAVNGDTITVFDSRAGIHLYRTNGDYLSSFRMPRGGNATTLSDGTPVVSMIGEDRLALVRPDGLTPFGPRRRESSPVSVFTVVAGRVWEAEPLSYEVRRFPVDGAEPATVIRRDVAWFPPNDVDAIRSGRSPASAVMGIAVDQSGRVWSQLWPLEEDLPHTGTGSGPQKPPGPEDYKEWVDGRVEVLTPTGLLIASERWDDPLKTPTPITSNRWYVVEDDALQSIRIVEPRLVAR